MSSLSQKSVNRTPAEEFKHQLWKQELNKWFLRFKTVKCSNPKCMQMFGGINCIFWHTEQDRRRDLTIFHYSYIACPELFVQRRFIGYTCKSGDICKYAHNETEAWYHPEIYKVLLCPYLALRPSCPFYREQSWFEQSTVLSILSVSGFPKIKVISVSNNLVYFSDPKMVCCVDFCPFYHSKIEKRLKTDVLFMTEREMLQLKNEMQFKQLSFPFGNNYNNNNNFAQISESELQVMNNNQRTLLFGGALQDMNNDIIVTDEVEQKLNTINDAVPTTTSDIPKIQVISNVVIQTPIITSGNKKTLRYYIFDLLLFTIRHRDFHIVTQGFWLLILDNSLDCYLKSFCYILLLLFFLLLHSFVISTQP